MTQSSTVLLVIAGFAYAANAASPVVLRVHGAPETGSSVQMKSGQGLSGASVVQREKRGGAEARGKHKVAQADADVALDSSARTREEARLARADTNYAVVIEKCRNLAGVAGAHCVATGKVALTKAWVEDNVDNRVLDRVRDLAPGHTPAGGLPRH